MFENVDHLNYQAIFGLISVKILPLKRYVYLKTEKWVSPEKMEASYLLCRMQNSNPGKKEKNKKNMLVVAAGGAE